MSEQQGTQASVAALRYFLAEIEGVGVAHRQDAKRKAEAFGGESFPIEELSYIVGDCVDAQKFLQFMHTREYQHIAQSAIGGA